MQIQMITKPDHYDWKSMAEIKLLEDDRSGLSADDLDPDELVKAKKWIAKAGWGFTLLIVVIWPVLSTPAGVFTKDYFAFWVSICVEYKPWIRLRHRTDTAAGTTSRQCRGAPDI